MEPPGLREMEIHEANPSRRSGPMAIVSSLLPGLAHVLAGRRLMGWILIAVDVVVLIALAIVVLWYPSELLEAFVTPSALAAIAALNLIAFAYRGAVTADAYLSSPRAGVGDRLGGVVATAIVVGPHLFLGSLLLTQSDLIESVFPPNDPPISASSTTSTISPGTKPGSGGSSSTSSTVPPSTTTTTSEARIWDGYERLNILLLGSDAGVGRIGTRTDTIIMVSIEPESGDVAMFSVPRNLTEAPLPEGMGLWDCRCFPDIITHLWANAEWYPDAFPGPQKPPVNALKTAVGMTFGADVHYYAKVDLAGFVGVVDALGGVTIDVPQRIVDESYPHEEGGTEHIVFQEGTQHLDGHHALAYARIRRHSGDFARMHRQRCLLGALAEQTGFLDLLRGYGGFAAAVKQHVETDIPVTRLPEFVELMSRVSLDRVATLRITRYNYGAGGHAGYQLYDLEQLRIDAKALMDDPTVHLETQDGEGFEATCDQSFD